MGHALPERRRTASHAPAGAADPSCSDPSCPAPNRAAPSRPPRGPGQCPLDPRRAPEAAARPLSPEALRRAIQAEEQRQVFALLGRLRRSRAS
ncbi:hypothetical protein [Deinococcus multiflagellatus]|uniref:Uncharacterized protein n=1 Tax=Deinococcus multiflagellatus TaxID=1656887 RepID=A0ABW1ZIQ6_9DEIO